MISRRFRAYLSEMPISWFFALLAAVLLASAGCSAMLVPGTSGAPVGRSARAGEYIATILAAQEPSLPSLHRNPDDDRYRVGLVLHSIDGKTRHKIQFKTGLPNSAFRNNARILADDGRRVWFHAGELGAYDYQAHKLYFERDLPRNFDTRQLTGGISLYEANSPFQSYLSPTDKYGAKLKSAALLWKAPGSKGPLALTDPPGFLLVYLSQPGLKGTWVLSRVTNDPAAAALWTAQTGLFRVDQVLPDVRSTAFIGEGPMVPGKVSEPLLVLVDNQTGALSTHTLWVPGL